MRHSFVIRRNVLALATLLFVLATGAVAAQETIPSTEKDKQDSLRPVPTMSAPTVPAPTTPVPAPKIPGTNTPATSMPSTSMPSVKDTEQPAAKSAMTADAPHSSEENIPTTTVFPEPKTQVYLDPKLAPPPLPKDKVALIGGVVRSIDQVRNRMTVEIFGGGKMNMIFDERTKFERDGTAANQLTVKAGDRVYADTQLANGKIFARNIHVRSALGIASASGQIISFNPKTGEVAMRDQISQRPINFRVLPSTIVKNNGAEGTKSDLRPNALASVRMKAGPGNRSVANEIDVIALPGAEFTFFGTLTHLDLRTGMLAVENKSDGKLYEIRFVPSQIGVTDDLTPGAEVAVVATFNGQNYTAKSVTVNRSARVTNPE